ncbi:MAG: purine/pyrimidine permease [Lentisphaeria bacterium]|nr:purine/pyrimidine permease [Lentisphaeria bacterium]
MDTAAEGERDSAAGAEVIRGVEDRLAPLPLAVAGGQHALAMFAGVVMVPMIIARAAGIDPGSSARLVSTAILVSGLATVLQAFRLGPVGCGYLCVMGSSGLFIQPCIEAAKEGGLALVFGMSLVLSPVEAVLSRCVRSFHRLAPAPVTGSIIALIAFSILPVSLREFGGGHGHPNFGSWPYLVTGTLTVAATLAAALSRRTLLRLGSVVVGIGAGTVAAGCLGLLEGAGVQTASWTALPLPGWAGWRFDGRFLLPFALAYVLTTLETYGDMNALAAIGGCSPGDRPRRIAGGILADAVASAMAGFWGTTPNTSYSGNIALVRLTGVASRRVGMAAGGLLVLLSLSPKLAAFIAALPAPVVGGSMVVAAALLLAMGLQIALREARDNRTLLLVGLALAVGVGAPMLPELATAFPRWLQPVVRTGSAVGGLTAILLHLVLPGRRNADEEDDGEQHEEKDEAGGESPP